jgi:ribose/xylose/arabinose/galactoside ABC-type transport system permease subunit
MDATAFITRHGPRIIQALVMTLAAMYLCRAQTLLTFPEKPVMLAVFFLSFTNEFVKPVRAALLFMLAMAMISPLLQSGGPALAELIP